MILINIMGILITIIISYCVGYIKGSKPIKTNNDSIYGEIKKYNK